MIQSSLADMLRSSALVSWIGSPFAQQLTAPASLLALNFLLFVAVRSMLRWWFAGLPLRQRLVLGTVIAVSIINANVVVLGVCRCLWLHSLLILMAVEAFALWRFERRGTDAPATPHGAASAWDDPAARRWLWAGAGAFTVLAAWQLLRLLPLPPQEWDNLTYHFYFPVAWLHSGTLHNPFSAFGDPAPTFSPMLFEFLVYWFMAPLRSDAAAVLIQVPFLYLSYFLLAEIALVLGATPFAAAAVSFTFVANPYFLTQGRGLKAQGVCNDLLMATLFFIVIVIASYIRALPSDTCESVGNGLPRAAPTAGRMERRYWLLAGLALGAFIGAKYIAFLFALPVVVLGWVWMIRRHGRANAWRAALAAGCGICLNGGFTFIRTFFTTDNPLFPLTIKLFGNTLFYGTFDATAARESEFYAFNLSRLFILGGLGAQFLLVFPLFLALSLYALYRAVKSRQWWRTALIVIPIVFFGIFYFLIPYRNIRFLFVPAALLYVAGLSVLAPHRRMERIIGLASVALSLLSLYTLPHARLLPVIGLALLGGFSGYYGDFFSRRRRLGKPSLTGVKITLVVVIAVGVYVAVARCQRSHQQLWLPGFSKNTVQYKAWRAFHEFAGEAGVTVAYWGNNIPYPLVGQRLQNRVLFVFPTRTPTQLAAIRLTTYEIKDVDEWRDNLWEHGVDFLYAAKDAAYNQGTMCIFQHPEAFTQLYVDSSAVVAAIVSPIVHAGARTIGGWQFVGTGALPETAARGSALEVKCFWECREQPRDARRQLWYEFGTAVTVRSQPPQNYDVTRLADRVTVTVDGAWPTGKIPVYGVMTDDDGRVSTAYLFDVKVASSDAKL